MVNPQLSVAEVADRFGISREGARGFVRFTEEISCTNKRGKRKPSNGRGGVEQLYEFIDGYEKQIAARAKRARLTTP